MIFRIKKLGRIALALFAAYRLLKRAFRYLDRVLFGDTESYLERHREPDVSMKSGGSAISEQD